MRKTTCSTAPRSLPGALIVDDGELSELEIPHALSRPAPAKPSPPARRSRRVISMGAPSWDDRRRVITSDPGFERTLAPRERRQPNGCSVSTLRLFPMLNDDYRSDLTPARGSISGTALD